MCIFARRGYKAVRVGGGAHFTRVCSQHAHTAHTQPTVSVGPVQASFGSSHGCNPSAACPGPTETVDCVCAVCARLSRRGASQVRAFARRKSAICPADLNSSRVLDLVKCKQSNPWRSGERE
jgi:hypothetical protein